MQHIVLDRTRLSDLDCFPKISYLLSVIEQSDLVSLTVHKRARKAIKSWKRDTLRRTLERCVTILRKLTTLALLFLLLFNESQVSGLNSPATRDRIRSVRFMDRLRQNA